MKYEIGKGYGWEGGDCPLPNGSEVYAITDDGPLLSPIRVEHLDWTKVRCFVPYSIARQPIERWAVYDHDGHFLSTHPDKHMADTVVALRSGRRVVLLREVTE